MGPVDIQAEIERIAEIEPDKFMEEYFPVDHSSTYTSPTQKTYSLSLLDTEDISVDTLLACFNLIKTTSSQDYKASPIGWNPISKKTEMSSDGLKYLIVKDKVGRKVRGFMSFMVDTEYGVPCVWMYEIHLDEELRGSGLGTHLLSLLEEIAHAIPIVEKVAFQCFTRNTKAVEFYKKREYELDEFSEKGKVLRSGKVKEPAAIVLSKKIVRT